MSEAIEIKCMQCGKSITVKAEFAGKKGKCPICGKVITIPDPNKTSEAQLDVNTDLADSERKKVAMSVAQIGGGVEVRKRGFFARIFGKKRRR